MTMSLTETPLILRAPWSRARPRPLHSPPTARGPLPDPPKPSFRPSSATRKRLQRHRMRPRVAVRCCPARALEAWSGSAAFPAALEERRAKDLALSLDCPGANDSNTDVVWDGNQCRLVVGVWRGPRPDAQFRSVAPPELVWYRAYWLPACDGARAEVTVRGGIVRIVVPWLDPEPAERMDARFLGASAA